MSTLTTSAQHLGEVESAEGGFTERPELPDDKIGGLIADHLGTDESVVIPYRTPVLALSSALR
jgi:hypothetical protein